MSFPDAVRHVLSHYADFSGRARRAEYWWFALFNLLVSVVAQVVDSSFGTDPLFRVLVTLGLFVPGLAVGVRRLHDVGRSGWWILIALVPIVGFIVLLVWFVGDSKADNQWGPNPKATTSYGWTPPTS